MYKAIKDGKVIAISDSDNAFKFMIKDSIVEDKEHVADDYAQYNEEYMLKEDIPFDKAGRIAELKELLAQDDYKIRKCAEYNLLGLEMPYDINEIHERNEAWRAEINELQNN